VKVVEKRTSLKIACLEEIGLKMGMISKELIHDRVKDLKGHYYDYIKNILKEKFLVK
jgi:glucose-1-phosphate thymidylyltransferase